MKRIALIIIVACLAIIVVAINNPKPDMKHALTTNTVVFTVTATVVPVEATTVTATAISPIYPPENQGWIPDPYKNHFFKGDCYSYGSEYSQGLTDFCQGQTLKIWSVWSGWYIAYEGMDGKSFKIPLVQGKNTISFPADAWMIRIGR